MKNKLKTLLAFMLVAVISLSVIACDIDTDTTNTPNAGSENQTIPYSEPAALYSVYENWNFNNRMGFNEFIYVTEEELNNGSFSRVDWSSAGYKANNYIEKCYFEDLGLGILYLHNEHWRKNDYDVISMDAFNIRLNNNDIVRLDEVKPLDNGFCIDLSGLAPQSDGFYIPIEMVNMTPIAETKLSTGGWLNTYEIVPLQEG